jgi:hypothetical protein
MSISDRDAAAALGAPARKKQRPSGDIKSVQEALDQH